MLGVRSSRGFFVSTFLFGLMFGIAAASIGITGWQALLMSVTTFSASAQFAALEFWHTPLPYGTIALSVFLVSTRNILLGMAMTHHFDGHGLLRRTCWLFLLNDPGVVTALSLREPADKLGYITGYGFSLAASWTLSTACGLLLAEHFSSDDLEALDFAGPLVLATMMVLFAQGSRARRSPWLVSGAVSLLLYELSTPEALLLPVAVGTGVIVAVTVERRARA